MLFEEFREGRNRNIEGVVTIMLLDSRELGSSGYPSGLLEMFESWLGFGVDCVRKWFEGVLGSIVKESALLEEERNIIFASSLTCVSRAPMRFSIPLTVSLSILQISADPAFVTGKTLINFASWTFCALVEVKRAFRLTFQWVQSQTKLWAVMIVPHQTNVHSDPPIYLS